MRIKRFFSKLDLLPFNNKGILNDYYPNSNSFNKILDPRKDNFNQAINFYLESIADKDLKSLKEICEPTFSNKIENNLNLIENKINLNYHDIVDIKLIDMSININVNIDRQKNENIMVSFETVHEYLKMIFYSKKGNSKGMFGMFNNFNNKNGSIVTNLKLEYTTKTNFYLDDTNNELNDNNKHFINFESVCKFEDFMNEFMKNNNISIINLGSIMNKNNKNADKLFEMVDILMNDWFISDSDNFMNGNPFIK